MKEVNKFCCICKKNLPINKFKKAGIERNQQRYRKECFVCFHHNWQKKLTYKSHINGRKHPIKDERIDIEYINQLYEKQQGKCFWLGIDIDFYNVYDLRYVSLDRLDNSKAYIKGNVVLATRFANLGRNIATMDEMINFVNKYLKKK